MDRKELRQLAETALAKSQDAIASTGMGHELRDLAQGSLKLLVELEATMNPAECPTCTGQDTITEPLTGNEEPYSCPDCGGSGRAEDCIHQ